MTIPAEVFNAANPFSGFDRHGGWGDYDDDVAPSPTQRHDNAHGAAHQQPRDAAAAVAAAMNLATEAEREDALRRLYGHPLGGGGGGGDDDDPARAASHHSEREPTPSPAALPGGASSLDELLSRAAALDRECFDLQNETQRWDRELADCHDDVERVKGALARYSAELAQVEASVAALNQWFQEHTCANDPERYERVGELNRDVCGLTMRITSLQHQLDTLLQGTLAATQQHGLGQQQQQQQQQHANSAADTPVSRGSRSAAATPARNDAARMGEILGMVSPSAADPRGSQLRNGTPAADRTPTSQLSAGVASPPRLPESAGTAHTKTYIADLEATTLQQDVLIIRLREAAAKRDRLLAQERENELEIQALRQKVEAAGLALPHAPIQHRTGRALRVNQSHTAAALAVAGGGPASGVAKRTLRLQSGILRDLTRELQASVRQVAHRCGVGEIAVEIASDATLLHCRGMLRAVNAFEDEVMAAAANCQRHRALGGMVTYAVPQVGTVVGRAASQIGALLQPPSPNTLY